MLVRATTGIYWNKQTYLRNVFSLNKVIHIKENFYRHSKFKQVIDDFLHSIVNFHVCRGGSLLLAQGRGTALEDNLLNNPEHQMYHNQSGLSAHIAILLAVLEPPRVLARFTTFSGHLKSQLVN